MELRFVPGHLLLDCLNMIITVHTCFGKEKKNTDLLI